MPDTPSQKTRYALCGLSIRAIYHFVLPLLGKRDQPGANDFSDTSEFAAIYDVDRDRVLRFLEKFQLQIPVYTPAEGLERMICETNPEVLLIASPDHAHCEQILCGLKHGLKVIVEKPMVINGKQAEAVLKAEAAGAGSLIVAHNYRYATIARRVKELLCADKVGRVTNVEFVYNLDTRHGSSYFYRWNRLRKNSGGLCIHKSVHHLDLVNWLLDSVPETVFAFGALNYYGEQGAHRPRSASGAPLDLAETRAQCPYFQKNLLPKGVSPGNPITPGWNYLGLPYSVQYPGDAYIYDAEIDIEDTYGALLHYRNGAILSYSCNFSTPWEGFTLAFNGTRGRLEVTHRTEPGPAGSNPAPVFTDKIVHFPLFGGREEFKVETEEGGHGGADRHIQRDLFGQGSGISLGLPADAYAGAIAIAAGEAIWRSSKEGRPYSMRELLGEAYRPGR
ncbi:MAG TPA: Gfo/Idh/MocA family oxidoreductase [Chthoniobacteraceae bacterium]|nr:Gfo/Idh/MocA family oxidoreductase [Chthoniobacteraceae bacterium]